VCVTEKRTPFCSLVGVGGAGDGGSGTCNNSVGSVQHIQTTCLPVSPSHSNTCEKISVGG
jgi:hypothetical protein